MSAIDPNVSDGRVAKWTKRRGAIEAPPEEPAPEPERAAPHSIRASGTDPSSGVESHPNHRRNL
jgi:hypothetical protein